MTDARVLELCKGLPVETFSAGQVLIAEGPPSDKLLILISGEVEVLRGATQIAETAEPGATFGEISALLGGPHTATVRALGTVKAYRLDDAAWELSNGNPLTYEVAQLLARRLIDASTYLADIKQQFADRTDHFAMVDEVLDALVNRHRSAPAAVGSQRDDDPRL